MNHCAGALAGGARAPAAEPHGLGVCLISGGNEPPMEACALCFLAVSTVHGRCGLCVSLD